MLLNLFLAPVPNQIQGCCLAPDWLSIHLEVVQKHSCAGSVCNFLLVASQTHYCASYPNHNHMGPSAALEFSHWQKHTNSAAAAASSLNLSFTFAVTASMNEPLSQHLSRFMGTVSGQSRSKPARSVCFYCHFKWQSLVWTEFWFIRIWSDWKVVLVTETRINMESASTWFWARVNSPAETAIDPAANREINKSCGSIFQKQSGVSG